MNEGELDLSTKLPPVRAVSGPHHRPFQGGGVRPDRANSKAEHIEEQGDLKLSFNLPPAACMEEGTPPPCQLLLLQTLCCRCSISTARAGAGWVSPGRDWGSHVPPASALHCTALHSQTWLLWEVWCRSCPAQPDAEPVRAAGSSAEEGLSQA